MAEDLGERLDKATGVGEWTCIARAVGDGYVATIKLMRVNGEDSDLHAGKQAVTVAFEHFFGKPPEKVGAGLIPYAESEDEPD